MRVQAESHGMEMQDMERLKTEVEGMLEEEKQLRKDLEWTVEEEKRLRNKVRKSLASSTTNEGRCAVPCDFISLGSLLACRAPFLPYL